MDTKPEGVGDLVDGLWAATMGLHREIRTMYGPKGTDDVLELQVFSACAIGFGIYVVGGQPDDAAKVLQSIFLIDVARRLVDEWGIAADKARQGIEARYEEYAPAIADLFVGQGMDSRLIDALDTHMMGKPAGAAERAKYLRDLVIVHVEMMRPIFAGGKAN